MVTSLRFGFARKRDVGVRHDLALLTLANDWIRDLGSEA
jgi:hypothetical protein